RPTQRNEDSAVPYFTSPTCTAPREASFYGTVRGVLVTPRTAIGTMRGTPEASGPRQYRVRDTTFSATYFEALCGLIMPWQNPVSFLVVAIADSTSVGNGSSRPGAPETAPRARSSPKRAAEGAGSRAI